MLRTATIGSKAVIAADLEANVGYWVGSGQCSVAVLSYCSRARECRWPIPTITTRWMP